MPIEHIGPNNIPVRRFPLQQGDSPLQDSATAASSSASTSVDSQTYRQYLINPQTNNPYGFSTMRANDNEELLHEIFEIDREAFAQLDSNDSYEDFKEFIENNGMSTYAINDENGSVVGYYQLEPIKGSELYIDSMGLKREYRQTKKGYCAIKYSWDEILRYAKSHGVEKLTLHADATNIALVNLYKRLGFRIVETYNNYYENGAGAHYMEHIIAGEEPTQNSTQQNSVQEAVEEIQEQEAPQEVSQAAQPNKKIQLREQFNGRIDAAIQELAELGCSDNETLQYVLRLCFNKVDGIHVFDEEAFSFAKEMLYITDRYYSKDVTDKQYRFNELMQLLNKDFYRKSAEAEKPHKAAYVAQIAKRCAEAKLEYKKISDVIDVLTVHDKDGNAYIDESLLEDILRPSDINTEKLMNFAKNSKLKDEDGTEHIDRAIFDACKRIKRETDEDYSINDIINACKRKDNEGKAYFDRDFCNELIRHFSDKDGRYRHDSGIYSAFLFEDITPIFPVKEYMRFAPIIRKDKVLEDIIRKYDKEEDVYRKTTTYGRTYVDQINIATMLKAVTYLETRDYGYGYSSKPEDPYLKMDYQAFNTLKRYCSEDITFKNPYNVSRIITACKERKDHFSDYKFNPELMQKAHLLKDAGCDDKNIADIIEACKLKEECSWTDKPKIIFRDDIFEKVLEYYRNGATQDLNPNVIKCSISKQRERYGSSTYKSFDERKFEELVKYNSMFGEGYDYRCDSPKVFIREYDGSRYFDITTFKRYTDMSPGVRIDEICDYKLKNGNRIYIPNVEIIDAYEKLKDVAETLGGENPKYVISVCTLDTKDMSQKFSKEIFDSAYELLKQGHSWNDVKVLICSCIDKESFYGTFNKDIYKLAKQLIGEGIGVVQAQAIAAGVIRYNNSIDVYRELLNAGYEDIGIAYEECCDGLDEYREFSELRFSRVKELKEKKLPVKIMDVCVNDKKEFNDEAYHLALDLSERGYSPDSICKLIDSCWINTDKYDVVSNKYQKIFDKNVFDLIGKIESLGISKDNIAAIINECKIKQNGKLSYIENPYRIIKQLKYMDYDDLGIAKIIELSNKKGIDNQTFEAILALTEKHSKLRDTNNGDAFVVRSLWDRKEKIELINKNFGDDILNYATSLKIQGYINFIDQCSKVCEKCSEDFVNTLRERLNMLPSPELKVKRLRIISGLASNVSEDALMTLVYRIKSPEMTDEQIKLANEIFSSDSEYTDMVNKFIESINTPKQSREILYNYLMKEKLNKQIDRPKPIEEQLAQMEKFAQGMLIKPDIPLEKKIKYIEEYKAKKADMQANPDKYTTPRLYGKPLNNLKKVVEAYVNIPNDDARFNNSITETMYANMKIETTPELLQGIHYDARYFDKLLAAQEDFKANFRKLIGLVKLNPFKPLTQIRQTLPEEGTPAYKAYESLGLIEQIEANLDTIRQFRAHRLNYEKWNQYDENLKGEVFSVEADPETEYKNARYNIINIFQDDLWAKIDEKQTEKLMQHLANYGYTIFNNKIFKNNSEITNNELEYFVSTVLSYIKTDQYWVGHKNENNEDISANEIEGITGFSDHLNGQKQKLIEIRNSRTVNDIHFRLSDDNNIGRNIFFGNHVGCCNSVESTYAGYSAPMHLLNNYNRGFELVDNFGNSFGNSLCYFADVDGELTFVIDSFEANGKLGSNPIVTDKLIEFAKTVCAEMGRPDAKIMIGPNYNNLNKDRLKETRGHSIKVIGTVSQRTYCDSVGGKVFEEINKTVTDRKMLEYS